jgi:A/G-specific adenine glycosylase
MGAPSDRDRKAVTRAVLRWYGACGRTLPWRDTRNPYRILVAEIMLHQTQVGRVLRIFPAFLCRFPSLHALAAARQAEVLIAWRGLGYNNRALRIHRLAQHLTTHHDGKLPRTLEECLPLPGIGKYTAHALLVSLYRRDLPVVDVNIRRVFSRLFWRMKTTADLRPEKEIWALATALVPRGRGYDWTQALMDLGAIICTARTPRCPSCPVAAHCLSRPVMRQRSPSLPRREVLLAGVPVRIHRGRIVEMLRSFPAGVTVGQIRSRLFADLPSSGRPWIAKVLRALERDGLIAVRGDPGRTDARVLLA